MEFLDEIVGGVREASWPLLKAAFSLSYLEVGLLISLPLATSALLEPLLGVMADAGHRRTIVGFGAIAFGASLFLGAVSRSFVVLLVSFILFSLASGAFVSLSQATLMDSDPERRERNMARWTVAGSAGMVSGPLSLAALLSIGVGWQPLWIALGVLVLPLFFALRRHPFAEGARTERDAEDDPPTGLGRELRRALGSLRDPAVLRWVLLLAAADLLLDLFFGFLALYLSDAVRASSEVAALAVSLWTASALAGDLILVPLIERIDGTRLLTAGAAATLLVLPAFLLVPWLPIKLVLLAMLGLLNAGRYPLLQARLYAALPGRSGSILVAEDAVSLVGALIPVGLGLLAQAVGLVWALWVLLSAPIVLLIGLPRRQPRERARGPSKRPHDDPVR